MSPDKVHLMRRKSTLRPVAFAAVVFSTVAITACLLTFPLVFHYVQTLQAAVQVQNGQKPVITVINHYRKGEVEYCKSRSRDMWREMVDVELATLNEEAGEGPGAGGGAKTAEEEMLVMELLGLGHRKRRQADDTLCCTCQQGPPGPDGGMR